MQTSSFRATIGGKQHLIGAINLSNDTIATMAMGRTHHVWILDRSHSLSSDINRLVDQVKQTAKLIKQDDLLSILYFAGAGVHSALVIGSKANEDIQMLLDGMRSTLGTTCFSEVMTEARTIAGRFQPLVDQTEITLFTDGNPVVPWSDATEMARTAETVDAIAKEVNLVAFNAIGYTPYYNRDFLNTLVAKSSHGRFVHQTSLAEFGVTMAENIEISSKLVGKKASVSAPNADILYLSDSTSSLTSERNLNMSALSANRNTFFFIYEDGKNPVATIDDGDGQVRIEFDTAPQADQDLREDFFYAYAARLYSTGQRQKALDIIVRNVHDKYLAERMISAFSPLETGDVQNMLENTIHKSDRLREGRTSPNFIPAANAFCLMDLFKLFFTQPANAPVIYIPLSKNVEGYKRIGRKTVDTANAFTASDEEVRAPVRDFVWNKDKLNLSIQFNIKGSVALNPKTATRLGLQNPFPAVAFRNYTFVKDGTLNINEAEFLIPQALWTDKLADQKRLGKKVIGTEQVNGQDYVRVVLDLQKLPIINRTYIDGADNLSELHSIVLEMTKLEASQKVANMLLDKVMEAHGANAKVNDFAGLTQEQITFLEENGISSKGAYGGINNVQKSAEEADSYMTRKMSFAIKGTVSLPSIADWEKMEAGTKTFNFGGQKMHDYYVALQKSVKEAGLDLGNPNVALRTFLEKEVDTIKTTLAMARQNLNLIKMAKVLTNDFFHGLTANDKGEYLHEQDDTTMVLKTERVVAYID